MDWNELIQTVLVKYAVPIAALVISALVARYLIPWLKKKEKEADTGLKKILIGLAVATVEQKNEQLKNTGKKGLSGAKKKEDTVTKAAKMLGDSGLKMSTEDLEDMIEAVLGEPKILNSAKKE